MTINFKVMNTTSSEVVLKIDGTVISSQFVYADSQGEFSLDDTQISNADSITIENSDVIYDITDSCKQRVNNYVKPIYKVEPSSGIHMEEYQSDNLSDMHQPVPDEYEEPHVNGFATDDFVDFRKFDIPSKSNRGY